MWTVRGLAATAAAIALCVAPKTAFHDTGEKDMQVNPHQSCVHFTQYCLGHVAAQTPEKNRCLRAAGLLGKNEALEERERCVQHRRIGDTTNLGRIPDPSHRCILLIE